MFNVAKLSGKIFKLGGFYETIDLLYAFLVDHLVTGLA